MEPPFEPAITARVDLGDEDGAAGTDSRAHERRAAVAGDVEARLAARRDVQVLGDAAGDIRRPADVAPCMSQGFAQVDDVDTRGGG
jgi:hypothetical protein